MPKGGARSGPQVADSARSKDNNLPLPKPHDFRTLKLSFRTAQRAQVDSFRVHRHSGIARDGNNSVLRTIRPRGCELRLRKHPHV